MHTREHILSIAFQLFFQKGFKGVTMRELVKTSGLSKGAFYHYFSSKEALYHEAFEKYLIAYFENFRLEYNPHISLRENLKCFSGNYTELTAQLQKEINKENATLNIYLLYLQTALNSQPFKKKLDLYYIQFHEKFEAWFRTAQSSGEIKPDLDHRLLATQMMALMEGLYILDAFSPTEESVSVTFNKIIDQFFDQIEIHHHDTDNH